MEPEEVLRESEEGTLQGFAPSFDKRMNAWKKRGILSIAVENRPKQAITNPSETPEEAKKRAFIFLEKQHET